MPKFNSVANPGREKVDVSPAGEDVKPFHDAALRKYAFEKATQHHSWGRAEDCMNVDIVIEDAVKIENYLRGTHDDLR